MHGRIYAATRAAAIPGERCRDRLAVRSRARTIVDRPSSPTDGGLAPTQRDPGRLDARRPASDTFDE